MFHAMVLQKDAMEGQCQRLQGLLPHSRFQLALPNGDAMPTHGSKLALLFDVALPVALNLVFPERGIGLGDNKISASWMPMPKASVDKDDRTIFAQHDVRMPGQPRMIEPIAKPSAKQEFPHHHLWFGVPPMYRSHAMMPLFFGHFVHSAQN